MPVAGLISKVAAVLAAVSAVSSAAFAQGVFPSRPITLVVPYSAGGGHDAMARVVAERLSARFGQNVLVDNKPGANGMIGAEYVSRAAADGYTLLFASPAEIVIAPSAYKAMRYDPAKDLVPVTLAGITPLVLVANPALGVKSVSELIALAKRKPNILSFGTSGNATSQHLAGVWLNNLAGIDLLHVPYKGAGPATNDVLGNTIPLAIVGMAPVLPHIRSGRLVALAVMTPERVSFAKDIPTVAETPGLKNYTVSHWMGVFMPPRTPPELVERMQKEFAAVLTNADVRDRLHAMGIDPVGNSSAEFRDFLGADRDRFTTMFRLTGLSPE
jgi:tripartite-type tricarboxylate transporter receptor subunit TctC